MGSDPRPMAGVKHPAHASNSSIMVARVQTLVIIIVGVESWARWHTPKSTSRGKETIFGRFTVLDTEMFFH
jgi:hypothetical protein